MRLPKGYKYTWENGGLALSMSRWAFFKTVLHAGRQIDISPRWAKPIAMLYVSAKVLFAR